MHACRVGLPEFAAINPIKTISRPSTQDIVRGTTAHSRRFKTAQVRRFRWALAWHWSTGGAPGGDHRSLAKETRTISQSQLQALGQCHTYEGRSKQRVKHRLVRATSRRGLGASRFCKVWGTRTHGKLYKKSKLLASVSSSFVTIRKLLRREDNSEVTCVAVQAGTL